MKKGLALLLAVVMVLAMGMTAFAASPGTTSKDVTSDTKGVTVTNVAQQTVTAAKNQAAAINKNANVLAVVDVKYAGTIPAGGVAITLYAAGVKKGDNIVLLHQKADGTWEQIKPSIVGDGYVTAVFTNLSPVAIVKLPAGSTAATTGTSPKTGYWG